MLIIISIFCFWPAMLMETSAFLNVLVVALVLLMIGYCLFNLYWSCIVGAVLPAEIVLFLVPAILLDFGA